MSKLSEKQHKQIRKFILPLIVGMISALISAAALASSNNPVFWGGKVRPYASQATDFIVTGTQMIDPGGECSSVSVNVTGNVTGVNDDGGGKDIITFELWDDGTLMDSEDVLVRVGQTISFSITMGFMGLYGTSAPGVGVYANELSWYVDPFYPTDVIGTCGVTTTGFYYPLGRGDFDSECGTWLSRDSKHGGCYFTGFYHIGVDMMADYNSPVYAISNGTVESISKNGWGSGNVAVIVKHTLSDGTEFYALYGHVITSVKKGDPVEGGKPFATIGEWSYGDHLHFGITEPSVKPKPPLGMMTNPRWPDTNSFVDPIDFINTYSPN